MKSKITMNCPHGRTKKEGSACMTGCAYYNNCEDAIVTQEVDIPSESLRSDVRVPFSRLGTMPHVCPVCTGRGKVHSGFYTSFGQTGLTNSTAPEQCKSCGGKGIIWG